MFQEDEEEFKEEDLEEEFLQQDDFTFGYGQLEQIGAMRETEEDMVFRTQIQGKEVFIELTPEQKFRQDLNQLLQSDDVKAVLGNTDTSFLKRSIPRLCLIKYKSPLLYILGFYIYNDIYIQDGQIKKTENLTKKLKEMKKAMQQYSTDDVLRYGRLWSKILTSSFPLMCKDEKSYDLKIVI